MDDIEGDVIKLTQRIHSDRKSIPGSIRSDEAVAGALCQDGHSFDDVTAMVTSQL